MISLVKETPSWDRGIYKTRTMFRVENTVNSKSGLYKIPILIEELSEYSNASIMDAAHFPRTITNESYRDAAKLLILERKARSMLYKDEKEIFTEGEGTWKERATPCVLSAIENEAEDGTWHNILFALGRFFKSCNIEAHEAIIILLEHDHWNKDSDYVAKTIRNAYIWRGTKGFGIHNTILTKWCLHNICRYGRR
jgi:hypothetical protein